MTTDERRRPLIEGRGVFRIEDFSDVSGPGRDSHLPLHGGIPATGHGSCHGSSSGLTGAARCTFIDDLEAEPETEWPITR